MSYFLEIHLGNNAVLVIRGLGSLFPFSSLLKMSYMSFSRLGSLWPFKIITELLIAEYTQIQSGEVF